MIPLQTNVCIFINKKIINNNKQFINIKKNYKLWKKHWRKTRYAYREDI